jgi:hypothetical protein
MNRCVHIGLAGHTVGSLVGQGPSLGQQKNTKAADEESSAILFHRLRWGVWVTCLKL